MDPVLSMSASSVSSIPNDLFISWTKPFFSVSFVSCSIVGGGGSSLVKSICFAVLFDFIISCHSFISFEAMLYAA